MREPLGQPIARVGAMDASPGKQAAKQAYGNIIVGFALLCICILASSVSGEGRGRPAP